MEMGQSHHHEFWTIGLNIGGRICRLPRPICRGRRFIRWRTRNFSEANRVRGYRSSPQLVNGIGSGAVEVAGEFPDLSKRVAFEPYLDLPSACPGGAV